MKFFMTTMGTIIFLLFQIHKVVLMVKVLFYHLNILLNHLAEMNSEMVMQLKYYENFG